MIQFGTKFTKVLFIFIETFIINFLLKNNMFMKRKLKRWFSLQNGAQLQAVEYTDKDPQKQIIRAFTATVTWILIPFFVYGNL